MNTGLAHRNVKTLASTASTPSDALRTSTGMWSSTRGDAVPLSAVGVMGSGTSGLAPIVIGKS
jgi:hypothetical protein